MVSRLGRKRLAVVITIILALGTFIWRGYAVNQKPVLAHPSMAPMVATSVLVCA